jgi:uncharacterized protein (TIGR00106 family)
MKATGEVQVIPIGVGVSLGEWVKKAHAVLEQEGLHVELHGQGTNVEGELSDILRAVEELHEVLHAEGAPRVSTALKLGTRTDKASSLADKVRSATE